VPARMPNSNDGYSSPMSANGKLRFGMFEVDFQQRELRKCGIRIHLQKKPFQILELLLRSPGTLVTRAELERHLWPDLHVNFGHGLNTAINSLRQALGDSPNTCRYIETRPGLGYRFAATVEEVRGGNGMPPAQQHHTPKPEAEQCYRKGKYLQNKMTDADLGMSIAHFEAAISHDPHYALAYAALAETYTLFAVLEMLPPLEARRRADEFTRIALQIDDQLAEAHTSLAETKALFDRDYSGAEIEYSRALHLDYASADSHRRYATFLSAMGRSAEALSQVRLAQELDPLSPPSAMELARHYFLGRKFQECITAAWQMLVLEPHFAPAQHLLGLAFEQLGLYEEAITELQNARICSSDRPPFLAALGHAYALIGQQREAETILRELTEISRQRYASPYWQSIIHVGLGEYDLAFQSIERACDNRDVSLAWLKVEPRFDPIRSDHRFVRLLESSGFTRE
jgi:DNA-binding winged helix-turn-helix (wHTH) protein/Flp pilus assembly protein TadD